MPVSYPERKRSSKPPTEEALGYRRILQEKRAAREAAEAKASKKRSGKSPEATSEE